MCIWLRVNLSKAATLKEYLKISKENFNFKLNFDFFYRNFQVYQTELEKVDEFDGFEDFISSFHIYRGRAKSRDEEQDTIVGELKVGEVFYF